MSLPIPPSDSLVVPLLDLPTLVTASSALTTDLEPGSATEQPKSAKTIDDFNIVAVLGRGSFGKVYLVRHKKRNELLAMKVMKKSDILERNVHDNIKQERRVLAAIDNPYLVKLRYAFQTHEKLFLLMTYHGGGEMFTKLDRDQGFIERDARFYAEEVIIAFHYLHSNNIIYRDLKPENVLFQKNGHLCLTDFGFAKKFANAVDGELATSFCGSLQYMAPEVVKKQAYGQAADWWTLGIFIYELIECRTPFYHKTKKVLMDNILNKKLTFPKSFSSGLQHLLRRLLERDPSKRITYDEIIKHPYFSTTNWDDVRSMSSKRSAPYVPELANDTDTRLFDERFTQEQPVETPTTMANSHRGEIPDHLRLPSIYTRSSIVHTNDDSTEVIVNTIIQNNINNINNVTSDDSINTGNNTSTDSTTSQHKDRDGLRHPSHILSTRGTPRSIAPSCLPAPPKLSLQRSNSSNDGLDLSDNETQSITDSKPIAAVAIGNGIEIGTNLLPDLGTDTVFQVYEVSDVNKSNPIIFRNSINDKIATNIVTGDDTVVISGVDDTVVPEVSTADGIKDLNKQRRTVLYTSDDSHPRNIFKDFSYTPASPMLSVNPTPTITCPVTSNKLLESLTTLSLHPIKSNTVAEISTDAAVTTAGNVKNPASQPSSSKQGKNGVPEKVKKTAFQQLQQQQTPKTKNNKNNKNQQTQPESKPQSQPESKPQPQPQIIKSAEVITPTQIKIVPSSQITVPTATATVLTSQTASIPTVTASMAILSSNTIPTSTSSARGGPRKGSLTERNERNERKERSQPFTASPGIPQHYPPSSRINNRPPATERRPDNRTDNRFDNRPHRTDNRPPQTERRTDNLPPSTSYRPDNRQKNFPNRDNLQNRYDNRPDNRRTLPQRSDNLPSVGRNQYRDHPSTVRHADVADGNNTATVTTTATTTKLRSTAPAFSPKGPITVVANDEHKKQQVTSVPARGQPQQSLDNAFPAWGKKN